MFYSKEMGDEFIYYIYACMYAHIVCDACMHACMDDVFVYQKACLLSLAF